MKFCYQESTLYSCYPHNVQIPTHMCKGIYKIITNSLLFIIVKICIISAIGKWVTRLFYIHTVVNLNKEVEK